MNTKRIPAQRSRSPQPASGYRDPWYQRPSDVGVLSEQFFESRGSQVKACPETALMYAVLEDAFLCFHKQCETEKRLVERTAQARDSAL